MLLWTVFALLKLSMQSRLFFPQNHCDTCILSIASDTARLPAIMIATAMIKKQNACWIEFEYLYKRFCKNCEHW